MPRKDLEHYWPDRIIERNERNLKLTTKECEKELTKLYAAQGELLRDEINKVLLKVVSDLANGNELLINDLYRNRRYWRLLEHINQNLTNLGKEEISITEKHLIKMYEITEQVIEDNVPEGLIKDSFLVPQVIDLKDVVHHTWCLDGKEFSDRIWTNKQKLNQQLQKSLADSVARGLSPWAIAQEIEKNMETSAYNAYRIARTETCHIQIYAQTQKYKEMGFTHGKYLGTNCCDECKKLNGQRFALDELEKLIPHHPHCTCTYTLEV
jgi:SPP1 gp7 family putative phage head morphogenesis protein